MVKIIECIPNFSEGKDEKVINELVSIAKNTNGVTLVDYSSDKSHNRSVFTLMGDVEGIKEVAFKLCKKASELINLKNHKGEHPRMGATDVIPFVPIKNVTMEECVEISKQVAKKISDELSIPTYLYENSTNDEKRKNLAKIREGQFENFDKKIMTKEWQPDFGQAKIHSTAGVTAVGARMPLIAFNVNLSTSDIKIAKSIAKIVRGSSGGFKFCKAIGVMLDDRNIAQVSMNMVNFEGTPLYRVLETIKIEARRFGVTVVGTELIGLTPSKALIDCAEYYLQIENFDFQKQIIENNII